MEPGYIGPDVMEMIPDGYKKYFGFDPRDDLVVEPCTYVYRGTEASFIQWQLFLFATLEEDDQIIVVDGWKEVKPMWCEHCYGAWGTYPWKDYFICKTCMIYKNEIVYLLLVILDKVMNKCNYKGKLLEWCAKHGLDYEFNLVKRIGGAHNPKYCYSLTIDDLEVATSTFCISKKLAQHNVSKKYLKMILHEYDFNALMIPNKPDCTVSFTPNADTHYYIDLENCSDLDLTHFSDSQRETFSSIGASKKVVDRANVVTNCTRSDAADVALIAKLTEDVVLSRYQKYAVISRDKLLLTAVEVLTDLYDADIKAVIV